MVEVAHRTYPLLFVLSGPSGVGKDTVIQGLEARFTDIHYATTVTTRPPRAGEIPGKSYFFITKVKYDILLDREELLAPAQVHGHWYGAPLDELRHAFQRGQDVLLKIDVQGAIQMRSRIPQAVLIFIAPPSTEDLIERLVARHTEAGEELEQRIRDARFEMEQMPQYDYVVVNRDEDVDSTVEQVGCIITAERLRATRRPIVLDDVDSPQTGAYTRLNKR